MRGAFIGLDIAMGPEALTRAVMEGVAFALKDSADALAKTGARFDTMLAVGGGTRSAFWLETLATVLGQPLSLPKDGDFGAALGAARLAIAAVTGADPESFMTMPVIDRVIEPRADLVAAYDAAHARYRALYPALKV